LNFFEYQDRARRNTQLLIALMTAGVLAMGAGIYALLVVFTHVWGGQLSTGYAGQQSALRLDLLLGTLLGTSCVVGAASAFRTLSLRGGGGQIAEMLGGRLVSGSPRDTLERRLVNVVEEMAIASGVPVPQVFVLDGEPGINAFAAGFTTSDAAVAVTRGCLEKLTREELQGVIAHEFSHVLNGDMRLNIRLMGVVFGIVCIGLLGRILMRAGSHSRVAVARRGRGGSPGAALFAIGLGVFLIGLIGELFGKLIKAAVSRQREFLADASAVQFTRNPQGIASALKKIGGHAHGAHVQAEHAEEASHFFFGDIHKRLFAAGVLATHPPLVERIRRIDPAFRGEFPEVARGIAQPEEIVSALAPGTRREPAPTAAAQVVDRIGTLTPDTLERGRALLAALPPALQDAAHNPLSACAIVYALLISDQRAVQDAQRARIEALSGAPLLTETARQYRLVHALPRAERLALLELLAPALRELGHAQKSSFSRTVQALIDADGAVSIFEYVLSETLRARLAGDAPPEIRARVRHRSLKSVRAEVALLLSLLAHAGDVDGSAEQAFAAGAAQLPEVALAPLPSSERLLTALSAALDQLRALAPSLRERLVRACAHAVLEDRRVTDDELTLLRALCDALECPLPPLPS
jgi:Zn-dependent protease with chaperone function